MSRLLFVILMLCSAAWAEPFDCMVAVTRQHESMDWWYAVPSEFAPKVNRISRVSKGEVFRIIPIFRNYGTDSNRHANITYDIEIVCPNGSTNLSLPKCEGHVGPAPFPDLLPSMAVVNMSFDPEDPYGEYRINVTAYDRVNAQTNRQSEVLQLEEFAFHPLNKRECDDVFVSYVAAPNPSRAASAFLLTEESFFNLEKEPVWSAIWFYKAVFENNDYLIPHLLDEFPFATMKQKSDIILVMTLLDRMDELPRVTGELKFFLRAIQAGRIPDPYDEITTGKQLDMLWAEFFATGTVAPIRQIISSLGLMEHVGTLDRIESGELDVEKLEVVRGGMLESVFQAALLSLRSNCKSVPLVYHYCVGILHEGELDKAVQKCLGMLLQSIKAETGTTEQPEVKDEKDRNH